MKRSQRRHNHRSRKTVARFEKLEDRCLLAAVGMNVLTVDDGQIPPDGLQSIDLTIDPTEFQFSSPKQEVTLGFLLGPAVDSALEAAPVVVLDDSGNQVKALYRTTDTVDDNHSLVLVDLAAGDYTLLLDGLEESFGGYELQTFVAGDADGDLRVDKQDERLIKSLFGTRLGQDDYLRAADVNLDGRITGLDHSILRRNVGAAVTAINALSFETDSSLQPDTPTLPAVVEGGDLRPIAALIDHSGIKANFVEDELLVVSDDDAKVSALAARWNGTVVKKVDAADYGVDGVKPIHLVKVDSAAADAEKLAHYTKQLDGNARGTHKVSSESGKKLLTVAAQEALESGLEVGVVWIGKANTFRDHESLEAPVGPPNPDATPYDQDAFTWTHLADGSIQDIATTEAWRALEIAGKLHNRVKVAVLDQGFQTSPDWPSDWQAISNVPFVDAIGSSSWESDKPWHGTQVMSALAAVPDNGFGAAGSGGPVVEPIAIFTSYDFFTSITAVFEARILARKSST